MGAAPIKNRTGRKVCSIQRRSLCPSLSARWPNSRVVFFAFVLLTGRGTRVKKRTIVQFLVARGDTHTPTGQIPMFATRTRVLPYCIFALTYAPTSINQRRYFTPHSPPEQGKERIRGRISRQEALLCKRSATQSCRPPTPARSGFSLATTISCLPVHQYSAACKIRLQSWPLLQDVMERPRHHFSSTSCKMALPCCLTGSQYPLG